MLDVWINFSSNVDDLGVPKWQPKLFKNRPRSPGPAGSPSGGILGPVWPHFGPPGLMLMVLFDDFGTSKGSPEASREIHVGFMLGPPGDHLSEC